MSISAKLLQEWNYSKNGDPENYTRCSGKKVSWICKNNVCGCHVWEARVDNRTKGNGCPYCSNKKVCIHASLQTTHPELIKEWDPRNKILSNQVSKGYGKKVSWICKNNICGCHVWEAAVYSRTKGKGCPYCSNQKVCIHSSIETTHPDLAEEWDPKNKKFPSQVSAGCNDKVSWICKSGACGCHVWEAAVASRTSMKSGCPYCSNQKVCIHSSIETTHPDLAEEWDPRNKILSNQVSKGYDKKVSWICKNNVCGCHVWEATVDNRTQGNGCPYCSGRSACIHTSIVTTHPELLEEWDSRNKIQSSQVSAGSGKKVSWICKNNVCGCHVWEARVADRVSGNGCPYCCNQKVCIHSSIVTTHPGLLEEWDYTKNTIHPSEYSSGCDDKVWWICKKQHTWEARVCNRTGGTGCPKCSFCGYSKKACRWIEGIMQSQGISIQYAKSPEGEYVLPDFIPDNKRQLIRVDGYCASTNTVYEFHGDMWHGNPKIYDPSDTNPFNYKSYSELYTETMERERIIQSLGYNLVVVWEQDFVE